MRRHGRGAPALVLFFQRLRNDFESWSLFLKNWPASWAWLSHKTLMGWGLGGRGNLINSLRISQHTAGTSCWPLLLVFITLSSKFNEMMVYIAMKSSSLLGLVVVTLAYDKCFQLNGLFKSLPVFVCEDWHGDGHVFCRRNWRLRH